jgi:hypothetical protein
MFSGAVAGVLHDFDVSHPSARGVPKDLGLDKLWLMMGATDLLQRVLGRCNPGWGVSVGDADPRDNDRLMRPAARGRPKCAPFRGRAIL